jgi:HAMP domain-containing protein
MQYVQLAILASVAVLLLVAVLALIIARRTRQMGETSDQLKKMAPDAKIEDYERPSTIVAEQIEEMVKRKLAQYPDLSDAVLDFGTMPDGTIDIWVNRKQYDDVEDIPDERIRQAIKEAVEEFNA